MSVIARFAPIPACKMDYPVGHQIGVLAVVRPVQITVAKAADVLQDDHPMHAAFSIWCKGPQTKRKAREFCRTMHAKKEPPC